MLLDAHAFNQPTVHWNTAAVTDMSSMVKDAHEIRNFQEYGRGKHAGGFPAAGGGRRPRRPSLPQQARPMMPISVGCVYGGGRENGGVPGCKKWRNAAQSNTVSPNNARPDGWPSEQNGHRICTQHCPNIASKFLPKLTWKFSKKLRKNIKNASTGQI